jgi:hypothetical protein
MSSLWCEYLSTEFARKCFILPTRFSGILPGRGSHHVAFLRLPDRGADGKRAFYDSMSDIQKGHRVSILFEVPGLAEYFENGYNESCLSLPQDGPSRFPFVQRLQKEAFMSLYISYISSPQ